MYVGSLFSGIGGFELGFEREGFKTRWFIEKEEYCQKVLKKNFPGIPIYGDIREIRFEELESVEILTGGFPCQDISPANPKAKGIKGERSSVWSYYAKAIGEIRPRYAVIENVPALANKGLNIVLRDIAEAGYDAEWFCLRASDFGALHRRERMFIIAYPNNPRNTTSGCDDKRYEEGLQRGRQPQPKSNGQINPSNSNNVRYLWKSKGKGIQWEDQTCAEDMQCTSPNTNSIRNKTQRQICEGQSNFQRRFITDDFEDRIQRFTEESLQGEQGFSWCQDVRGIEDLQGRPDIPESLFRGGRDGVPSWMDRIKCLGNAVVPQVAQFIARRIKEVEGG